MEKIKKGLYKHYKGNLYKILGFGFDSNTLQEVVIYQGQYISKEFGDNPTWVRPLKEFKETVNIDGKEVHRFEFVKE